MAPVPSIVGTVGGTRQTWNLTDGLHRIGRDPLSEIPLLDPSVSRAHATLLIDRNKYTVEDVGSRNGSWLNGKAIDRPTAIQPGDQLQFGDVVLQFRAGDSQTLALGSSTTRFQWEDIQSDLKSIEPEAGDFWRAVMEAAQLMVLPKPAEELFPAMLDLVESITSADQILLLLREDIDARLEIVASRPEVGETQALPLSKTLVKIVLQNRESVLVEDATSDPQFDQSESIANLNLHSAMAAPLFDNEQVIGLIYAHTQGLDRRFDDTQLRAFTMLANLIAIKLTNARLLEEHRAKLRLEQEMEAAGHIQQRILPESLPEIAGYERSARLDTCLETAGDFYDVRSLPDGRVYIVVGDVSGKGSGAALLMSHVLAAFRVLVAEDIPISTLGQKLNEYLFESSDPTHFVTLWMAELDPSNHRLTYMNAGHNPPFYRSADGEWKGLTRTALPIGMLPDGEFLTEEIELAPNSLLVVFTDGLTEAQSGDEFFGEDRLKDCLERSASKPLVELSDDVFHDVAAYSNEAKFEDDCTLFLLRRRT